MLNTQPETLSPSRRIRVMHIMFSLEPGGLENGVVNISNGLNKEEFETTILCLERIGDFAERLNEEVIVDCLKKKSGFRLATVLALGKQIRTLRPDVIHTHNLGPLIYAVLARITSFSRVPILHGEHGTLHGEDLGKKRLLQRNLLYRFCRRVHTVSESLREHLSALGLPSRHLCSVINGVDCEQFHPPSDREQSKIELGLPPNSRIIGMVGRFIPGKRHLLLLEAFEKMAATPECQNTHLMLLGDTGPEKEAILAAINHHPARNRIIWKGHLDDPAPWYQVMDLLAMPSSGEGLSNALLEAMACGVPCVAHPACGANEVISNDTNGVLKSVESADELAEVLSELILDPERMHKLGGKARETVVSKFSLNRMVKNYAILYHEIVFG